MREIKFRVYDSISNKTHPWGVVKEHALIEFELEHYTLLQYTGLKDKNGKDIYEGDIIKFHTGVRQRDNTNMKICFNGGCFGFRGLSHDGVKIISSFIPFSAIQSSLENNNIWLDTEDVLEVIGNIYDKKQ